MDSLVLAIVAFGSAIVGSLVGFVGSRHLAIRDERTRQIGVIRALLGELGTNSSGIVQAVVAGRMVGTLSSAVWDDEKIDIVLGVNRSAFSLLITLYNQMPTIRELAANGSNPESLTL